MFSQEDKELYNAISYLQSIGDWNSGSREIVAGRLRQARECIQYLEDRNDAILENRPRLARPNSVVVPVKPGPVIFFEDKN